MSADGPGGTVRSGASRAPGGRQLKTAVYAAGPNQPKPWDKMDQVPHQTDTG